MSPVYDSIAQDDTLNLPDQQFKIYSSNHTFWRAFVWFPKKGSYVTSDMRRKLVANHCKKPLVTRRFIK